MPTNIDEALVAYGVAEPTYCLAATVIYCDNQGAQALAKNPTNHSRMKHMDLQHHFVREKIAKSRIQLKHVFTAKQVANGLIKLLPRNAFEKFRNVLGLHWLVTFLVTSQLVARLIHKAWILPSHESINIQHTHTHTFNTHPWKSSKQSHRCRGHSTNPWEPSSWERIHQSLYTSSITLHTTYTLHTSHLIPSINLWTNFRSAYFTCEEVNERVFNTWRGVVNTLMGICHTNEGGFAFLLSFEYVVYT